MKKFALLFTMALAGGVATGCYKTETGQHKMGVPFSKDRIESRYERPITQVFQSAHDTLAYNGTLTGEDTINHTIIAKIDNRTVWVAVDQIEANVTRILVQARKSSGAGDVALAAELDKQIALRLR
jgi:hypothetical protein